MRILAVSDIHIDYPTNKKWVLSLSEVDYKDDILILSGDISADLSLVALCFRKLSSIFYKVLFVPGNHDVWLGEDDFTDSLQKYRHLYQLASQEGVITDIYRDQNLSIIPLQSWYDYTFGNPNDQLHMQWADYYRCVWPAEHNEQSITRIFLDDNLDKLNEKNKLVVSFSHFLPFLSLLPKRIPDRFSFLQPVLGTSLLGEQIERLQPHIHVYGHSHVNQDTIVNSTRFINNALGYPHEHWTHKELVCLVG